MNSRPGPALFDRLAPRWDRWKKRNWYYHLELERLCTSLIPPGKRVLELGCATGDLLNALRPSLGVGVDFSPEMIRLAKAKYPHLTFELNDAEDLTVAGDFDYIVLSNLVGSLQDIWKTFRGIRRLVTPETRLLITYYNHLWEPALTLAATCGLKTPLPPQNWLPLKDISNILRLSDFEPIRTGYSCLLPLPIPVFAWVSNRFLSHLPIIRSLAVTEYVVARPVLIERPCRENTCSVVVPCRDEVENIEPLIERMPTFGRGVEIIFVDGDSADGTREQIQKVISKGTRDVKLIRQSPARGKGDAVQRGFQVATGDILIILDADLSVAPEDLPKFYEALCEGKGELIIGSRLAYPLEKQAMRFLNLLGNKAFSLLFTWLLGQRITDTLCGTKALFRRDYDKIIEGRGFFGEFDPFGDFDLIFGAARQNLRIVELPVRYWPRAYGVTKISRFKHGWLLLRMSLKAMRKLKFV